MLRPNMNLRPIHLETLAYDPLPRERMELVNSAGLQGTGGWADKDCASRARTLNGIRYLAKSAITEMYICP